jgi:uncharacterized membrane protein YfhO
MILLNLNELLKFALDSVENYVGTIILLFLLGVLAVGLLTHLAEKIAGVVVTIIMISSAKVCRACSNNNKMMTKMKIDR